MFLKRFYPFAIKNLLNVRKNILIIFNLSNQSLKVIFKLLWLFDSSVLISSLYYTLTPKKSYLSFCVGASGAQGFIHTYDLLGMNYCVNYLLNNSKTILSWRIHTCYLVNFLRCTIMGCLLIFHDCAN